MCNIFLWWLIRLRVVQWPGKKARLSDCGTVYDHACMGVSHWCSRLILDQYFNWSKHSLRPLNHIAVCTEISDSNTTVLSLGTLMYCKVPFQWYLFIVSFCPDTVIHLTHLAWMYRSCQEEGVCISRSCFLFEFLLLILSSLLCSPEMARPSRDSHLWFTVRNECSERNTASGEEVSSTHETSERDLSLLPLSTLYKNFWLLTLSGEAVDIYEQWSPVSVPGRFLALFYNS